MNYDKYPPYGPDPFKGLTGLRRATTRFAPDTTTKPKACPNVKEPGMYWVLRAHWAEYAPQMGWTTSWAVHEIDVNLHGLKPMIMAVIPGKMKPQSLSRSAKSYPGKTHQ